MKPRIRKTRKGRRHGRWCYEIPTLTGWYLITSKLTFSALIAHLSKLGAL